MIDSPHTGIFVHEIPVRNRWGRIVGRYTVVRVTTDGREDVWIVKSEGK